MQRARRCARPRSFANVAEYGPNYLLPRRTSRLQHFLLSHQPALHHHCTEHSALRLGRRTSLSHTPHARVSRHAPRGRPLASCGILINTQAADHIAETAAAPAFDFRAGNPSENVTTWHYGFPTSL